MICIIKRKLIYLINTIKNEKQLLAIPVALMITIVIVTLINFEPHDKTMVNNRLFQTTFLSAYIFTSSYVIILFDTVLLRCNKTIRDQRDTIRDLKDLLLEKENIK